MFFSSSSSSSSSASPPAVVLFARILCVSIRLFLLPPLKHTLRAEEEEEEEEEYDVDAVFDDFATREARCKVVVCFVVIFASSHTTFRMPFALLFIHIVILFLVFARQKRRNLFKSKRVLFEPLCLSLLGPKRRERESFDSVIKTREEKQFTTKALYSSSRALIKRTNFR